MPGHRKRSKGPEVTSISQGQQAERDDDEEDSLLVDMPAEEERGVATQSDSSNEGFPSRAEKELRETYLPDISHLKYFHGNLG